MLAERHLGSRGRRNWRPQFGVPPAGCGATACRADDGPAAGALVWHVVLTSPGRLGGYWSPASLWAGPHSGIRGNTRIYSLCGHQVHPRLPALRITVTATVYYTALLSQE